MSTSRLAATLLVGASLPAAAFAQAPAPDAGALDTVVVTARLRQEDAQSVPISLSVVDADLFKDTATNNIAQMTQLVPSLNYTSPNPRNTAFTIRGLGSSVVAVSQANDGLEPGVGFYVDEVYHARPATAAFDFVDLEQAEVLRGPQGTLFGKNTTAGAINLRTKAPSFDDEATFEASAGQNGYWQAKAAVNGALLGDTVAGRLSGITTRREGVLYNTRTGRELNDVNNSAVRAQLLIRPAGTFTLRLIADYSSVDTTCCTQVYFAVAPTLKPVARQYAALAAGRNYAPASTDPYDRVTDIDGPLAVKTSEGGTSAIAKWDLGAVELTSVSAWRFWNWDAENDRDYTGLSIQTSQHIPSRQDQYSQELRIASTGTRKVDYVAGLYWFAQTIEGTPITVYGPEAAYWLLGPAPTTPANLLTGYRTDGETRFHSDSYAAFGEASWHATDRFTLTGGLRYTSEDKDGRYSAGVSGGLATTNTALNNSKLSILRPQAYTASVSDGSASGRLIASFAWTPAFMSYASFAKGSKSGGINMSGLPLNAANQPALATAVIEPEKNTTVEIGVKSALFDRRLVVNADVFDTKVKDFQANVVDTGPGALRGYLANIDEVRVKGAELDGSVALGAHFIGRFAAAYNDGKYVSYANGPCPIEAIGNATTVCNLSGKGLSALPRWNGSAGGELRLPAQGARLAGEAWVRADWTVRSGIFGDASDSAYTRIAGYGIVNASLGFREAGPWEVYLWARNLLDRDSMQNLTVQAGNSGLIVGTPGDPRAFGLTLRASF
jgi:iron complex outermembrane receptor protein